MQFWYNEQLRQYRLQFIRAFSNFYVQTGNSGSTGSPQLIRVPCMWGDQSRLAATIVQGNSENKIPTVPFISCYMNGISLAADRRQDPQLITKVQVNERLYDTELGQYTDKIGNRYTVERHMPVPYNVTMQVDIWTNNLNIKEQLTEQLLVLFNPMIDIQTSVNPLDWTVLTVIELQDSIAWTSRSIPIGTDNPIDVMSMQFKIPIWLNPPAKLKRQAIIQEIVTNIVEGSKSEGAMEWDSYNIFSQKITTIGQYSIQLEQIGAGEYKIYLCNEDGSKTDTNGNSTVTNSKNNPLLMGGMNFIWNGISCTIKHVDINQAVLDIRESLTGTQLNCVVVNENTIQFINMSGGNNVFVDGLTGTLSNLGLQAGTYPGGNLAWWRLLEMYGIVKTYDIYGQNSSQLRLKTVQDLDSTSTDIVGWFKFDTFDQNSLIWFQNNSTIPNTNIQPISAIVNPTTSGPGLNLPSPQLGQRYLLTESPANNSLVWGNVIASGNDIIEYTTGGWVVKFCAEDHYNTGVAVYVNNLRSDKIYQLSGGYWSTLISNKYAPGYWRVGL
jgi:hypothetical protein